MQRIMYLRSTSIINDSRAIKEISTFLKNGYSVSVMGWDRERKYNDTSFFECDTKKANISFFKLKCSYGGSIKNLFKMFLFQIWLFVKLIAKSKEYDIIHSCDLDTGIIANVIKKIFKKKLVYDIYDYYVDSHNLHNLSAFFEKREINVINNSDLVILCTEQRREQIKKSNPQKVIVIHNTPEILSNSKFKEKTKKEKSKNKFKVVYAGILPVQTRLLKEFCEEVKGNDEIEFHIAGFGELDKYLEECSREYDNIKFYGQLKYSDVLELEQQCDILFATYDPNIKNHRYSAPNKVYEAMALGKPIIVCKNTGIDDLVDSNKLGKCINYNAIELLDAIIEYKNNSKILNKIQIESPNLYKKSYSWNIMEQRLLEEYKNLK